MTSQIITIDITLALKNVSADRKNNSLHKEYGVPVKAHSPLLYLESLRLGTLSCVFVLCPSRGSNNLRAAGPGALPH